MLSKQEARRKQILNAKFTDEEWGRIAPFLDNIKWPVSIDNPLDMFNCIKSDIPLVNVLMDILDERIDSFK